MSMVNRILISFKLFFLHKGKKRIINFSSSFLANADRIALPLTGPGGKIAVFETKKPGRIPDGVQPVLINGTSVMDFAFDPFDNSRYAKPARVLLVYEDKSASIFIFIFISRLAVACDDGYVRVWKIPEGGLVQQVNEPDMMFAAHADKITILKFHPLAKDVILTAAFDRTVKIWDLTKTEEPQIELDVRHFVTKFIANKINELILTSIFFLVFRVTPISCTACSSASVAVSWPLSVETGRSVFLTPASP